VIYTDSTPQVLATLALSTMASCLGCVRAAGAELRVVYAEDPYTRRSCRAITHPVPFCTYFGETDPSVIECDIQHAKKPLSS
jgi:hypothetical protein